MQFLTLLKKECALELKSFEALSVCIIIGVSFSLLISFGLSSASIPPEWSTRLFPALWWMSFIFTATLSLGRSYDSELEHRGFEGVLLAGVSPSAIYFSKLCVNTLTSFIAHALILILLSGLLDVSVFASLLPLLGLSLPLLISYGALSTLLITLAAGSRLRGILFPLLLLPLLIPLFLCAIEISNEVLLGQGSVLESVWFPLGLFMGLVYVVAGWNLYPFVLKE